MQPEFELDFAMPCAFAAVYRTLGMQVVPAFRPGEQPKGSSWKRPLGHWNGLQTKPMDDALFDRLYGQAGLHRSRMNMGVITGVGGYWVLDLDIHKHPSAADWWRTLLVVHNNGLELDTPTQVTGGGGLQLLFRAPLGWMPPSFATPMGVDVRGRGGFAMLPPSMHESGNHYAWQDGLAPWDCTAMVAPDWLCQAVDDLNSKNSTQAGAARQREIVPTEPVVADFDGLLRRLADGRERYMSNLVWALVVDRYRKSSIKPTPEESEELMLMRNSN